MNILESLTRLRDDLKLWVTNNLNVLNAKIDDSIIPIDDKLDDSSSNPIQNKVITKEIENLNTLIGGESVSSQIETAISQQEHFSGDYYDLVNAPNIIEDESGAITIADEQGKIIFKVDAYGAQSTAFAVDGINILSEINNRVEKVAGKGLSTNDFTDEEKAKLAMLGGNESGTSVVVDSELSLSSPNPVQNKVIAQAFRNIDYNDLINEPDITEDNSETISFTDGYGNAIAKIDKDGIHSTGLILNGENIVNKINGKFKEFEEELQSYDRFRVGLTPLGNAIPENSNLNSIDLLKVNSYYCGANKTVATLLNCPTAHAFIMHVYSPLSNKIDNENDDKWVYRVRKILDYEGQEYIQAVYSDSEPGVFIYRPWKQIAKTEDITAAMASHITYGTTDLTPGSSSLTTGKLYIVYE